MGNQKEKKIEASIFNYAVVNSLRFVSNGRKKIVAPPSVVDYKTSKSV